MRKLYRHQAVCSKWKWDKFTVRFYPGWDYIPITEENFYWWWDMFERPHKGKWVGPHHIAVELIRQVCPGCQWSGQRVTPLEPGTFDKSTNTEAGVLACISALQCQGVFT